MTTETNGQPHSTQTDDPEGLVAKVSPCLCQKVTQVSVPTTDEPPTLIIGLGNPGDDYAEHRHNIGFQVVDTLARHHSLKFTRRKELRARVAEGQVCGIPVVLAKPQTYMNLSGRAVTRLTRAHRTPPEKTLVVYDELDLPLGRLRLRPEGGSGGHRGLTSIITVLGTQAFPRLRLGIGRPPGRMDPADYVLESFGEDEQSLLEAVLTTAVDAVECWLVEGVTVAMDRFNRPPAVGHAEADCCTYGEKQE